MAEDQKQLKGNGEGNVSDDVDSSPKTELFVYFENLVKERRRKALENVDLSPKLDPLLVRAIDDVKKTYRPFYVKNPHPIRPNDHYLEIMRLKGWLDLDLNDPDLAPLFK